MVPIIVLNHYFPSSLGFEFYYSIKKHEKECGLGFWFELELRVKFSVISLVCVLKLYF